MLSNQHSSEKLKKSVRLPIRIRRIDADSPMPIHYSDEIPLCFLEFDGVQLGGKDISHGAPKITGYMNRKPDVEMLNEQEYTDLYPLKYSEMPRKRIRMDPLMSQYSNAFDYDMDSDDEVWLENQSFDLSVENFENMMSILEKGLSDRVVTLHDAGKLLGDDEAGTAVFNYWISKRIATGTKLSPLVESGGLPGQDPRNMYLAFRNRLNNVETKKCTKKVDIVAYSNLLLVRERLLHTMAMLKMVVQREELKRQLITTSLNIVRKQYETKDFRDVENQINQQRRIHEQFHARFHVSVPHLLPLKGIEQSRSFKRNIPFNYDFYSRYSMESDSGNVSCDDFEEPNTSIYDFQPFPGCKYQKPVTSNKDCTTGQNHQKYGLVRYMGRGGRISIHKLRHNQNEVDAEEFWKSLDFNIVNSTSC